MRRHVPRRPPVPDWVLSFEWPEDPTERLLMRDRYHAWLASSGYSLVEVMRARRQWREWQASKEAGP